MAQYSIGIDFGTLSVRAVLADVQTGKVLSQSEYVYPHKILTELPDGKALPKESALAHPSDYIEGLQATVTELTADLPDSKESVISIGVDATSCSVIPLTASGLPLCLQPEFENHPHAYIKLWKHHTAAPYAKMLQKVAEETEQRFLTDCGNFISSESFFPKVLETFEEDREVYYATHDFMEVGEWIVMMLTGKRIVSQSMAAFKRFYHPFRGYPDRDYFETVRRDFGNVVKDKIHGKMVDIGQSAGTLHPRMAEALGLSEDVVVTAPIIDAHASVPACGGKNGDLICVIGTSSVSLMVSHNDTGMDGVYSSASHSFLPDTYGHEAGQCSVGDTLQWFCDRCVPPDYFAKAQENNMTIHQYLTHLASESAPGKSGLLALDWWNGVRTPMMDSSLSGALIGLTNATRPEEIYRALLESIAFGTRRIKEIYENHGHTVTRIFCCGGIPQKNELFCQILADVLGREIIVVREDNACALGSAIMGAVATSEERYTPFVDAMCCTEYQPYSPGFKSRAVYDALYKEFIRLSDTMSGYESVMRNIQKLKGTL